MTDKFTAPLTDAQIAEQLAKEFGFVIEPVFLAGNRRPDCFRIVWKGSGCTPATKTEVTLWTALQARERERWRVREALATAAIPLEALSLSGELESGRLAPELVAGIREGIAAARSAGKE